MCGLAQFDVSIQQLCTIKTCNPEEVGKGQGGDLMGFLMSYRGHRSGIEERAGCRVRKAENMSNRCGLFLECETPPNQHSAVEGKARYADEEL